jgi:hypothetical protein
MKKQFKKSVIVAIFFLSGWHSGFAQKNTAFQKGEELLFKVSFGFFDAAEAKMVINSEISTINDNPTYKIDVFGQTLGIFKLFYVKDNWGSYLDTAKIIPHHSYRHIEEGRYRKHEQVAFDHKKKNAHVKLYDRDNQNVIDTKDYPIPSQVQDIVSGFYYLRTLDFKKYKPGDIINLVGFFDKETYNVKLIYKKKESIETNIGKFESYLLVPVIPKNKLFRGEHPISVWVSDDKNKIPLRIKAKLMIGSLDMEIMDAKNLRNN